MRNKLIKLLLYVYLFFVPFGPLVVIFGINFKKLLFTRLDVFCAILASSLFIFNLKIHNIFTKAKFYLLILFFYFLISSIFSINPIQSFSAFFSLMFNLFILNMFLICFKGDFDQLAKVLLFGFILAGSLVLYEFILDASSHYTSGRFYLVLDGLGAEDLVDPNIQASGMVLAFLASYNLINFKGVKNTLISLYAIILILSNLIIFNSRSAFLGLIIGGVFIILNKSSKRNLILYLFAASAVVYFSYFILTNFIELSLVNLFDKFSTSGEDSRLELINETIKFYSSDFLRIFFGLGLDQTNPHNEFLKIIFSLGAIGFILVILCSVLITRIAFRVLIINRFRFYYFCLFILTISMFYEHKKLFWISIILAIL